MLRSKFHPARDAAIAGSALLLFAWLAMLASRGGPLAFDTVRRDAIHTYASPGLTIFMEAASQAGGGWFLWPAGAIVVFLLARGYREWEGGLFALAVVGANLISESMKLVFHRQRPEPWFGYSLPSTFSFPSGHAFVSFCFYLCLAEILIREDWPLARKAAVWIAAFACTTTIGLSRVYLGVHYHHVLAGYAAAIVWTTVIRVAHHAWQRRRRQTVRSAPGS